MANFFWLTASGPLLNPVQPNTLVSALVGVTEGSDPTFSIIAGSLPSGLTITPNGTSAVISGIVDGNIRTSTSSFVIRAFSKSFNQSIDRTFSITVLPFGPPVWSYSSSTAALIGPNNDKSFTDYSYVSKPLIANKPANAGTRPYNITYSLSTDSQRLPPELTISNTGTLEGLISIPVPTFKNFDTFIFNVVANNGNLSSTQTFVMTVTYINSTFQPSVFLGDGNLGTFTDDIYIIIPVTAFTSFPAYGLPRYSLIGGSLPPDLELDADNGHLYGVISTQTEYLKNYQFVIAADRFNSYENESNQSTKLFNMDILKSNSDSISWVTTSNLGLIYTSVPSILNVVATHTEIIHDLKYYSVGNNLPTGLTLDPSGNILGNAISTGTYTITVVSTTGTSYTKNSWDTAVTNKTFPVAYGLKTFNLTIEDSPLRYTNMYIKPFFTISKRLEYQNFITNTEVFDPEYIYRPEDLNFGVQKEFKLYMVYGIQQLLSADSYRSVLLNDPISDSEKLLYINTFTSITAVDSSGIELYDVVYLDIIDSNQGISILDKIRNKFLLGLTNIKLNPNYLPIWQIPKSGNELDFLYGVVLCYAIPGKGAKIINNLKRYSKTLGDFDFYNVDFVIDKIIIEQTLSSTSSSYLLLP